MEGRPDLSRRRMASRIDGFSNDLKLDVRAHQRTYEGAYTRTAIGCLSFAIVIIKLFSKEFLLIGTVYTAYGCMLYFVGVVKSYSVDTYYDPSKKMEVFITGGKSVLTLSVISLFSYVALLVLIIRL